MQTAYILHTANRANILRIDTTNMFNFARKTHIYIRLLYDVFMYIIYIYQYMNSHTKNSNDLFL